MQGCMCPRAHARAFVCVWIENDHSFMNQAVYTRVPAVKSVDAARALRTAHFRCASVMCLAWTAWALAVIFLRHGERSLASICHVLRSTRSVQDFLRQSFLSFAFPLPRQRAFPDKAYRTATALVDGCLVFWSHGQTTWFGLSTGRCRRCRGQLVLRLPCRGLYPATRCGGDCGNNRGGYGRADWHLLIQAVQLV